jgi:glucan biosynthesis protein
MRIFPRDDIKKLGVARSRACSCAARTATGRSTTIRPEVHDSDGLLIAARNGEWLWRPLENPHSLTRSAFATRGPRGFGLFQRDRNLDHYQDFEARQDLRPERLDRAEGDWGAGRVELVEIPTNKDINDNIVSYWVPDRPVTPQTPGDARATRCTGTARTTRGRRADSTHARRGATMARIARRAPAASSTSRASSSARSARQRRGGRRHRGDARRQRTRSARPPSCSSSR